MNLTQWWTREASGYFTRRVSARNHRLIAGIFSNMADYRIQAGEAKGASGNLLRLSG
ncbi:hypothetical protein [Klebsiella aerogenes EA1509E]|jgi:hypothetical protein|nr:hypothetical protein [Klebsiella aerogenes EA1509E]